MGRTLGTRSTNSYGFSASHRWQSYSRSIRGLDNCSISKTTMWSRRGSWGQTGSQEEYKSESFCDGREGSDSQTETSSG